MASLPGTDWAAAGQSLLQRFEAVAGLGANFDDRRAFEERAADQIFDFEFGEAANIRLGEIGFGERDYAAADAEQAANVEVLARLRLDAFIGGYYEQNEIDAACSGEHVADEALVAGNIYEADADFAESEKCEADINGDAAALFFFEAIRMSAGERGDECGFAVVDVTGSADYDVFHCGRNDSAGRLCSAALSGRHFSRAHADATCEEFDHRPRAKMPA